MDHTLNLNFILIFNFSVFTSTNLCSAQDDDDIPGRAGLLLPEVEPEVEDIIEDTFTLMGNNEELIYYPQKSSEELFDFELTFLPGNRFEGQLIHFEQREREFEWNIETFIQSENITVKVDAYSNLDGTSNTWNLYLPGKLL